MLPIYEKLTKDGRIGPNVMGANGRLVAKAFEEYPKFVHRKNAIGKLVTKVVHSQSEELAWKQTQFDSSGSVVDPLADERNKLVEQVADQADQLARLQLELSQMRAANSPMNSSAMSAASIGAIKQDGMPPTMDAAKAPSDLGLGLAALLPKTPLAK